MLTAADVKSAKRTTTDRVLWDHPGFGVRIRPSGAKSWLVQYRTLAGQTRRMALGRVEQLPLAQARREADRIIASARLGKDPAAERGENRRGLTVADLAEQWLEAAEIKETTAREYRRQLKVIIIPKFGRKSARSLTAEQISSLFFEIRDAKKPYLANRVVATLSSMLGWAARRGMIPANPAQGVIDKRDKGRERANKRTLSEDETHRFLRACETLRAEGGHAGRMAACFELILFCGLRPSDAYRLQWSGIDWEAGLIHFAEQKTDGTDDDAKPAYLRGPAAALLRSLEKTDETWIFPSPRRRDQPVHDGRKVWARIQQLAEFDSPPPNPKCLRKTHGSLARNWRHDLGAISKSLRHASQQTTEKHYAFLGDPFVAAEQDVIQTRIAALVNPKATVREIR